MKLLIVVYNGLNHYGYFFKLLWNNWLCRCVSSLLTVIYKYIQFTSVARNSNLSYPAAVLEGVLQITANFCRNLSVNTNILICSSNCIVTKQIQQNEHFGRD